MKTKLWNRIAFLGLICLPSSVLFSQDSVVASSATARSSPAMSEQALKVLVSGIAFYPDDVIADIFASSQDMVSLHSAAQGVVPVTASDELKRLAKDPQILKQLDSYPATTARLALAARTQLADVWKAIDTIRVEYEQIQNDGSNTNNETTGDQSTLNTINSGEVRLPVRPLARVNAFMAGLVAEDVVDEISDSSVVVVTTDGNTVAVADGSGAVAVSDNGVAAAVTVGDSTKFGGIAGGTTTTPNGSTVTAVGGVKGEVTKTENGGSYSKDSAGVIVNDSTGAYAAGKRSTGGSVTNNADGSTSFSRSAVTQTESSNGNTTVTRNSSGKVTGNGDGSFQSDTTIESSHGDATISTEAGNGQINSTVTTDNGTKEFSAGDGEIQNRPESTDTQKNTAKAAEVSSKKSGQRVSRDQMDQANQMMTAGWGRLESHPKNQSVSQGFQRNNAPSAMSQRPDATRGTPPRTSQRSMSGQRGNVNPSPAGRNNNRSGGRSGRGR